MVLSDVEETVTIVEVEDDNEDEAVRVIAPSSSLLLKVMLLSITHNYFILSC